MGGIHGNKRFQCEKCEKAFSWRLDMIEHHENCLKLHKEQKSRTGLECYGLEFCFLCGIRISGDCSEEASIINGSSKLKYSQQPVMMVLAKILEENKIKEDDNYTYILCKKCMENINKWDEKENQLKDLGREIRNTFRKRDLICKEVEPNYKVQRLKSADSVGIEGNYQESESPVRSKMQSDVLINSANDVRKIESLSLKQEATNELTYAESKEFHCDCGKIMMDIDALVHHQLSSGCKVHTNSFPCKYCKTSFSERKLLIQHKKICDQNNQVNGGYECDICYRRFLKRGRVETHKRNVHNIGTTDHQLCSYCGRTFGSSYNIKNNLAREHGIGEIKKITCGLCGGEFCDKSSLRNHIINIHKEKKYVCEHCGKKFPTAGTRNHHINEMHNNKYTYDCTICGQQFRIGFKYRYHMRKMHNNVQYGCDSCSRTFVMKGDLYRHVRGVHMGIRDPKRYPCKICRRLFPSLYKVKRHMRSHHILQQQQAHQQPHMVSIDMGIGSEVVGDTDRIYRMALQQQTSEATASIIIEEDSSCPGGQQRHIEHEQTTATISVHNLLHSNVDMTNLSSEMIVREVSSDNLVAAEQLIVGSMPDVIESGQHQGKLLATYRGHETITLHTENQDVFNDSQEKETCDDLSSIDIKNRADLVTGTNAFSSGTSSSIMPLHQMIIIHEAASNNSNILVEQHVVNPITPGLSITDASKESSDQIHLIPLTDTPFGNKKIETENSNIVSQQRHANTIIETDVLSVTDKTDNLMETNT